MGHHRATKGTSSQPLYPRNHLDRLRKMPPDYNELTTEGQIPHRLAPLYPLSGEGSESVYVWHPTMGGEARKVVDISGMISVAAPPTFWEPYEYRYGDLADLYRLIRKGEGGNFALNVNTPIDINEHGTSRRRNETIAERAQRLVVIDVDGLAAPDGIDWTRQAEAAINATVRLVLPAEFHRASYTWHWSASAGAHRGRFIPGDLNREEIRARLYFLSDVPLTGRQIKARLLGAPIDLVMYETARLNFACRPRAIRDPLSGIQLSGLVRRDLDFVPMSDMAEQELPPERPTGGRHVGDWFTIGERIETTARANLGAWVPHLGLHRCEPKRGGGYQAVPVRPSHTGRAADDRKRNLHIDHDFGVCDWGLPEGERWMPCVDLVSTALDLPYTEARRWMNERIGPKPPPLSPDSVWLTGMDRGDSLADVEVELVRIARRFGDEIIPVQQAREERFQALVSYSIPNAFERLFRMLTATNARREELERRDADVARRSCELETMEAEVELHLVDHDSERQPYQAFLSSIYAEQYERGEVAAEDREFLRAIQLAYEFGAEGTAVANELRGAEAEAEEIASSYPCIVADPAPGSGKTTVHIRETLSRTDIRVATMSPTNRLGWDIESRSSARAWAGLGADGPDGEPLCRRRDEGAKVEAAGGSRRKLCDGCMHRTGCPAWDMIDSWFTARHVAGTHNHLALDLPGEMTESADPLANPREFDAVVIDESPVKALRPGHNRLEIGDLIGCLAFQNMVRHSAMGGIHQSEVRLLDRDKLKEWKKQIQAEIYARADMSVRDLLVVTPVGKLRLLVAMINAVLYDQPRGDRRGDLVRVKGGLLFAPHGELASWTHGKPIMLMSATPESEGILSDVLSYGRWVPKLIKGKLEFRTVRCRPRFERMRSFDLPAGKNVSVRRYENVDVSVGGLGLEKVGADCATVDALEALSLVDPKTFRNRRAELERRQGLVAWLRKESADGRRVVVVATAKIRTWLAKQGLPIDLLEWGKAIGVNAYESHESLVVLGDQTEPGRVQHLRACDFAGEWQDKLGHDPVSEQMRAAETWQAVERLRTRRDKHQPVTIHVWSDVPLPIDAEEVDGRVVLNAALLEGELPASQSDGEDGGAPAPIILSLGAGAPPLKNCIATSSRGIMVYHGLSKRKAEQRAKEYKTSLPDGYASIEVILRAEDGSRSSAAWVKFAVRKCADAIAAIQQLTGRRVEKLRSC